MNKATLLIVDDKPDNIAVLQRVIAGDLPGCEIITADSCETGLALAAERSIDCALIDVQMPGVDGVEMCRRLKSNEFASHFPIILITSHQSTPDSRARALEAGADDFISRPIDNIELIASIGVMLRIKWAEQQLRHIKVQLEGLVAQRTQALTASEAKYRDLYDHAPDMFISLDARTSRIIECNDAWARTLGYPRAELLGRSVLEFYHPDCLEQAREVLKSFLTVGEVRDAELALRTKEGGTVYVCLNASAVRDEQGGILYSRSVLRDVTERKRMEEERRRLAEQLYQAQKMEAIGQLAGGVAHDFNNLLMVIEGYVVLAQQAIPPDHTARVFLNAVLDAAAQGAGVTKSLLTFSRGFEASIEPVVPAVVVEEASRLLQHLLPQSIELTVEAPQGPRVWMPADRVQLEQVILNLAINARDAMPGGGRLRIACRSDRDEHASPGTTGENMAFYIEIADTGTGISPEQVERVFDPFFTTKPRGRGTGLGLSIAYGIVKNFGGRIEVRSEVGKGSTFTIILPCRAGEPEVQTVAAPPATPRGQGETVLLADDNPQILDLLTGFLESCGYTVIQAADGEAMVNLWVKDRERIRLIVADNDMPKRSGPDAILQIRRAGGRVPAILITGLVESEYRDQLAPGTVVVRKPFQLSELAARIRGMLDANHKEPGP